MKNSFVSGIVPMFLSGMAAAEGKCRRHAPGGGGLPAPKRLLVACAGASQALTATAGLMVSELGEEKARITVADISASGFPFKTLAGYDGVIMGIDPDGSGHFKAALSFIRAHRAPLAHMPLALFSLQPPSRFSDEVVSSLLSLVSPLDFRNFNGGAGDAAQTVSDWVRHSVWPLMETRWLADMVFPVPDLSPCTA
ncbi:MAG: hypothetical protein HUN04_11005 [Desulfobacter sp.]|nr:MAG: hypothetical protein HUN04_11005 [Desulfobacter sp.]